jgi:hypothetical protein
MSNISLKDTDIFVETAARASGGNENGPVRLRQPEDRLDCRTLGCISAVINIIFQSS